MSEFVLLNSSLAKDHSNGKIFSTETPEFITGTVIAVAILLSYYAIDFLNFNIPEWGDSLLSVGMLLGYGFAIISLFLSRNAGNVNISPQRITIDPKKNPEKYPDSPIYIDEHSEIRIFLMKSIQFGIKRTLLHFQVTNDENESNFAILLKSKKKHQQYFELLESWYTTGYDVKEFDQLGQRIFKINQGNDYADVQKIKKEYGIEWQ